MAPIPRELIDCTPGITGEIVQHLIKASIFKQPQLALAAALCAVGVLKGHRVRTETDLRTNIYTVGLGAPSSGKGFAIKVIDKIFTKAGAEDLISGKPASDTGLLASLVEGRGRRIVQWDEFGLALSKMTTPKAPAYKAGILDVLMEVFSSADKVYRGSQYTNPDKKRNRIDIDQPCLCLYGVSTPIRFYDALTSDFGSDGFISRLLVFESDNPGDRMEVGEIPEVSPELVSKVRALYEWRPERKPGDDKDLTGVLTPEPVTVTFTKLAYARLREFQIDCLAAKKLAKEEAVQSIWGRASEHLQKIALIVEPERRISGDTMAWAIDVTKILIKTIIEILGDEISDSDHHRITNKVYSIVRSAGQITRSQLARKTQWLKTSERKDILQTLIDSERIRMVNKIEKGGARPETLFEIVSS